jgi:hypothetical protein
MCVSIAETPESVQRAHLNVIDQTFGVKTINQLLST